jgi:hypothetical protein
MKAAGGEVILSRMTEIIFEVLEDPECGLRARALGHPIYTQGEDIEELRNMVRDAVQLFFEEENTRPKIIRLHFVREEVIAA